MPPLHELVAARAEELDLTAYAIAKQVGCDPSTVRRFFRGKTPIQSSILEKLLAVLSLEIKPIPEYRRE